jgi:hypothetical protein
MGHHGGTWYGTHAAKLIYGTRMSVLDIRTWVRGEVPDLGLIEHNKNQSAAITILYGKT